MIAIHRFFDSIWNTYTRDVVPIVAAIIAALVGGLVSGFLVHWFTRAKKEEEVRDSDIDELRELLSALTKVEMYESDGRVPVTR